MYYLTTVYPSSPLQVEAIDRGGGMDMAAEPAEEFNLDSYSAAALESLLGETGNDVGGGQHQHQQGWLCSSKSHQLIVQPAF